MSEISKLRMRLRNSSKSGEYRMTVEEARKLLSEIDNLKLEVKKEIVYIREEINTNVRTLDGGSF